MYNGDMDAKLKQLFQNNLWFGENGLRPASLFFLPREAQSAVVSPPTAGSVWGIDISHWNIPPVNLTRMRDLFGMSFVIVKACDGSLNSRYVDEHVTAAKNAGLPFVEDFPQNGGRPVWIPLVAMYQVRFPLSCVERVNDIANPLAITL